MDKLLATLRTLGILAALWAILFGIGLISGVIGLDGSARDETPEAGEEIAEERVDGGTRTGAAARAARDGGMPSAAAPIEDGPSTIGAARFTLCDAPSDPSLSLAQLFGDERPELIVGCAGGWEIVAVGADGVPARVLVVRAPAPTEGLRARSGPVAVGDVDGDGLVDAVLPLNYETPEGTSRGGALYWLPRDERGGVREPVTLAPIAAFDAAVAPLDANVGAEIVAMNRANALAQLPSDAWVFGGGSAPRRSSVLAVGLAGEMVRMGDLDRDGNADVVALARGRVALHFGNGQGAFPRTHAFELPGAREIALGDFDADGGLDLAVLGDDLRWIHGGPLEGMEPRVIAGAPTALRGLRAVDVDADGKLDLVGWDHPRLTVLRQTADVAFEVAAPLSLAGEAFGPRRHAIGDVDGDGAADDLVLLGTSTAEGPLEIVIAPNALGPMPLVLTPRSDVAPVADAPLVLRVELATPG